MTLLAVALTLVAVPLLLGVLVLVLAALTRTPTGGRIPRQRGSHPNTRVVVSPSGVGLTRRIGPARFSTSGRGAVRLGSRVTGVFRWR